MMLRTWTRSCYLSFLFWLLATTQSFGGVFNLPHFVTLGEFAVGMEPELIFMNGATPGVNLKYTHGVSDMNNLTGILGAGGAGRGFRVGGAFTFDFFPDLEKQPGIGLAIGALFVQLPTAGSVELTGTPYIHKNLTYEDNIVIEPFFAVPIGLSLSQGLYQPIATLAFGALFQHNEHFKSVVELGVGLGNTSTYLSGVVVYYH